MNYLQDIVTRKGLCAEPTLDLGQYLGMDTIIKIQHGGQRGVFRAYESGELRERRSVTELTYLVD